MSRALVLGGGGPIGIAWETGVVAGLMSSGIDLADADLIVGTSAGSAVGAQLALGRDMQEAVERYRGPDGPAPRRTIGATPDQMKRVIDAFIALHTSESTPEEARVRMGEFALGSETPPEEEFVEGFEQLDGQPWPDRYVCTTVDVRSGEFKVWDASSEVPLIRAVAASCAVPGVFPPVTIGGARYMDGGTRSVTNADVAKGNDRVLVVSVLAQDRSPGLQKEIETLRAAGAEVEVVCPDAEGAEAMGPRLMDPARVVQSVEAGLRQGLAEADRLRDFWPAG